MTREEDAVTVSLDGIDIKAFDVTIKALEHETIFSKIRAEILRHCYEGFELGSFGDED